MDKGNGYFYGQSLCVKIRCDELAAAKEVKGLCLIFFKYIMKLFWSLKKKKLPFFPDGKIASISLGKKNSEFNFETLTKSPVSCKTKNHNANCFLP